MSTTTALIGGALIGSVAGAFMVPFTRICFSPPRAFVTLGGISTTASPAAFSGRK